MKNIFDYATKELSQDAFLSWFIANCNEPSIGEYSYRFINFISGLNFKLGDIKTVTIKQQEHNIDIIVDLWDINKLHYVIIIEDKTSSSAHSGQLKRYANIMDKWNRGEDGYKSRRRKVFYKVDYLTDQDKEEIKKGNEGFEENDRWRTFDLKQIHDFFSEISETKSEILNFYAGHINDLYEDHYVVSSKPIKEWNYTNYQTFFKKVIESKMDINKASFHSETWEYQGRLVSYAFYYHPTNELLNKNVNEKYPCFAYPLVEFVFKKYAKSIIIYTHVTHHWFDKNTNSDKWTWKCNEYEPNVNDAFRFTNTLKKELAKLPNVKVRKMSSDRDQTISTDSIGMKADNSVIENTILEKLKLYFDAFEQADKCYKNE